MGAYLTLPSLTQIDYLPDGLLSVSPSDLYRVLPQPTLVHLPGRDERPLFVSVLQHGNETTGFLALQQLLKKYGQRELPRALSIFFGNIEAARRGLRRLDGQVDYNRVWPGTETPDLPEAHMMQAVVAEMARRDLFASVDVHNNTGMNPHYACINKLDHRFFQLAVLFSRLVVFFTRPKGVQSAAFAQLCPAVTLECGKSGQAHGVEHALEFLDGCLHISELADHPVPAHDIDFFRSVAQVYLRDEVTFSFRNDRVDLVLDDDLDHMNFTEIPAGTEWGSSCNGAMPLRVVDAAGRDVTDEYFAIDQQRLILTRKVMPSSLTLDERIIRQDCLCYLMERASP
jgi:succinylglutamate desuccinylase